MSEYEDGYGEVPEPIKRLFDMLEIKQKHKEAVVKELDKQKEEDEREIMMDLWAFASNNTESYHHAFEMITAYASLLRKIRRNTKGIPYHIASKIFESLSKQLEKDAKLFGKIQGIDEKFEKELQDG